MKRIVCLGLVLFVGLCLVGNFQAQTKKKQKKEKFQIIQMADNETQGANVYENLKGEKVFDGWKCFISSIDAENELNKIISGSVEILKTDKDNNTKRIYLTDSNEVKKRSFRIMTLKDNCIYVLIASTTKLTLEFEEWQESHK